MLAALRIFNFLIGEKSEKCMLDKNDQAPY